MAKNISTTSRVDTARTHSIATCRGLAEKLKSDRLEFTLIEDSRGARPQFARSSENLAQEERRLVVDIANDIEEELIVYSTREGKLTSDHWRVLATARVTLCVNLQHRNVTMTQRRRNELNHLAGEAIVLLATPPTATIKYLQGMIDKTRCVYWALPDALLLEVLSKVDEYVNNSQVEYSGNLHHPSKRTEERLDELHEVEVTASALSPEHFLARELTFFVDLLAARPHLTLEQLRQSLEHHLHHESVVGCFYGHDVNRKWVEALADFLECTGLRVSCISSNLNCSAPSLPRYQPAKSGQYYQFKTQHNDAAGKQRNHGGPTTIPSFDVVYAPPRLLSASSKSAS